jgi:hypothetical protein
VPFEVLGFTGVVGADGSVPGVETFAVSLGETFGVTFAGVSVVSPGVGFGFG